MQKSMSGQYGWVTLGFALSAYILILLAVLVYGFWRTASFFVIFERIAAGLALCGCASFAVVKRLRRGSYVNTLGLLLSLEWWFWWVLFAVAGF